ncbi:hypothetical protein EW146_g3521 [Bondarzewia mesenterica]|uniref:Cytochrome P450 n=1 Tax=Bondarzewia mesenterica TaxID=1095465 RepID=A0A4S4LXB7_9AGAM|nr:hypothetical protein EW146_g3521 [Bondarzewia mesenterica]
MLAVVTVGLGSAIRRTGLICLAIGRTPTLSETSGGKPGTKPSDGSSPPSAVSSSDCSASTKARTGHRTPSYTSFAKGGYSHVHQISSDEQCRSLVQLGTRIYFDSPLYAMPDGNVVRSHDVNDYDTPVVWKKVYKVTSVPLLCSPQQCRLLPLSSEVGRMLDVDFLNLGLPTVAAVAVLSIALLGILTRRARRPPLPPGPKSSWFGLGQPVMPKLHPWRTYAKWRNLYGDIIYMRAFGKSVMVLNSTKVADDLLDKRGAIYSSRPATVMLNDVAGWKWALGGIPYGDSWRKHRGLFLKHFHARASPRYEPIQIREATRSSATCFGAPRTITITHADSFCMCRGAAALVMKISYGHDVAEEGDIFVTLAESAMASVLKAGIFGTYLVDYFPILKYVPQWFPGAEFKRQGKEWSKYTQAMLDEPYKVVKAQMASGTAEPSLMAIELENLNDSKEVDITLIKNVAAVSYAAGADTTVAALMSFFLNMLLHPEVQHKAQEEVDRVVGPDRLPEFSDRDQLPYVGNVVWECLRWNPVTPLGLPRATMQDDVYDGYWIPRGTTILPNIWAMFHDEAKYPDAFAFRPERFEDQKKNTELGINDLPHIVFGFGRRVCPGRWLALDNLWINIASLLSVYNISKPKDTNGTIIEPEVDFVSSLVKCVILLKCVAVVVDVTIVDDLPYTHSHPKSFKCSLIPRSETALALIKQTENEQGMTK